MVRVRCFKQQKPWVKCFLYQKLRPLGSSLPWSMLFLNRLIFQKVFIQSNLSIADILYIGHLVIADIFSRTRPNLCQTLTESPIQRTLLWWTLVTAETVHYTSWKLGLYFVYIFIADCNCLTNFYSSDPSFNRNILTSLYFKYETSAHAHLRTYSFTIRYTSFTTWC